MNKPFSVIYEEFRQELINLINNSSLPLCVIESVLKNYLVEINEIVRSQYRTDKLQYENFLAELEKTESKIEN